MNAFYSKDKITIYRGKAEEILPLLKKSIGTLVMDSPYQVKWERIAELRKVLKISGKVLILGADEYGLLSVGEPTWIPCPALLPRPEFGHPTVRPLETMRELLTLCAVDPVVDPYMGTGTTLVAAKMLGREAIGIEQNEKDCRTAVWRLEQCIS